MGDSEDLQKNRDSHGTNGILIYTYVVTT